MELHKAPLGQSADGDKPGVATWPGGASSTGPMTVLNAGSPMSFPGKGHGTCVRLVGAASSPIDRPGYRAFHETIAIAIAAAVLSEETDTRWGREPKKRACQKEVRAMILNVSRFGV